MTDRSRLTRARDALRDAAGRTPFDTAMRSAVLALLDERLAPDPEPAPPGTLGRLYCRPHNYDGPGPCLGCRLDNAAEELRAKYAAERRAAKPSCPKCDGGRVSTSDPRFDGFYYCPECPEGRALCGLPPAEQHPADPTHQVTTSAPSDEDRARVMYELYLQMFDQVHPFRPWEKCSARFQRAMVDAYRFASSRGAT